MYLLVQFVLVMCFGNSFGKYYLNDTDTASSDFSSIVNTPYFVDKTYMINDFFKPSRFNVLVTAPRRFGKSTNMDMVRRYCEIIVDQNGNRIDKETTGNFKVFSGRYNKSGDHEYLNVYKDVNISKFFNDTFGEFPVIYLDFKLLNCNSFDSLLRTIGYLVAVEYRRHRYLLNSKIIRSDRIIFRTVDRYYNNIIEDNLTEQDLAVYMLFLSEILFIHFNQRVIVLIDEYDAPIQKAIFKSGKDIGKIIDFIREFISNLLKSNAYIERSLLNACVRLSGVSSTDANNIDHFPFGKRHPFSSYYGFSLEEVTGLAKKFDLSDKMTTIETWYSGYFVVGSKLKMLNTFSIVKYFCSNVFCNYWVKSGYILNLEKIFQNKCICSEIERITKGKPIEIKYPVKLDVQHIERLKFTIEKGNVVNKDVHLFLSFLLDMGYLTVINEKEDIITVKAPNQEVIIELKRNLYSVLYFKNKFNITDDCIDCYLESLKNLDSNNASCWMLARSIIHLFKPIMMPENESELKSALFTFSSYSNMFSTVNCEVAVRTNRLDLKGKFIIKFIDILIIRKDETGIILELKYGSTAGKQKFSPYIPLEQIIHNTYYNIFNSVYKNCVKNKLYIGIFVKKKDKLKGVPLCSVSVLHNTLDINKNVTVIYYKEE